MHNGDGNCFLWIFNKLYLALPLCKIQISIMSIKLKAKRLTMIDGLRVALPAARQIVK